MFQPIFKTCFNEIHPNNFNQVALFCAQIGLNRFETMFETCLNKMHPNSLNQLSLFCAQICFNIFKPMFKKNPLCAAISLTNPRAQSIAIPMVFERLRTLEWGLKSQTSAACDLQHSAETWIWVMSTEGLNELKRFDV